MCKKEKYEQIRNQIRKCKIPIDMMRLKYEQFKNLTKTVYTSTTKHEENHTREEWGELSCPTCGKLFYSKGWLTIHRKQSDNCIADYYDELEQRKICTNAGFGLISPTCDAVIKQRNYHCGQETNAYHNHLEA